MIAFGHVGDGNVHIVVHVPGREPQPKLEVQKLIYGLVRTRRGSISAEHGIGTFRRPFLDYSRSREELTLMRTLKSALDPTNIMNPGRVVEPLDPS